MKIFTVTFSMKCKKRKRERQKSSRKPTMVNCLSFWNPYKNKFLQSCWNEDQNLCLSLFLNISGKKVHWSVSSFNLRKRLSCKDFWIVFENGMFCVFNFPKRHSDISKLLITKREVTTQKNIIDCLASCIVLLLSLINHKVFLPLSCRPTSLKMQNSLIHIIIIALASAAVAAKKLTF